MQCTKSSDGEIMDPVKDIYPCNYFNCNKYHPVDGIDKYIYSIKYLKIDRLKLLLSSLNEEQVLNLQLRNNTNILSFIINNLFSYCCGKIKPNIDCVTLMSIDANDESTLLALELINYLCTTYPKLINDSHISSVSQYKSNKLLTILRNHQIDDPYDECCIICFSSSKIKLIDNICVCKSKIHLDCLIKTFLHNGSTCKTCKKSNGGVKDKNGRVLFPFSNIYKQPLMSNYLIIPEDDIKSSLHFAIAYLQVDRVKYLLDKMEAEDYDDYVETADYYALHGKLDGKIKILDSPYTNLHKDGHIDEFNKIEKLLEIKSNKRV